MSIKRLKLREVKPYVQSATVREKAGLAFWTAKL